MLPTASAADSVYFTHWNVTIRRRLDDFDNLGRTVGFFLAGYSKAYFITGAAERNKADLAINPADTVPAKCKFFDPGYGCIHVKRPLMHAS